MGKAITLHNGTYLRWQSVVEWMICFCLLFALFRGGVLPGWKNLGTDFPNDYLAASIYHKKIPFDRLYEWKWFQRQNDYMAIPHKMAEFAPHPPFCVLPVLPVTTLSPLLAKRVWTVISLFLLALSVYFLQATTELGWRRVALITLCCIVPLQENQMLGQYYILLLALICASYFVFKKGKHFAAGILLSFAVALKIFPFIFLCLFVRKKKWTAAWGLIAGIVGLTAISMALFGIDVHRIYFFEILPRTISGDVLSPYAVQWNSFSAIWHRLFLFEPELNPSPLVNSDALYVIAQAGTAVALLFGFVKSIGNRGEKDLGLGLEWAALMSLMLLLSPIPAPYHYSLLVLSGVLGINALLARDERNYAITCLALVAFSCAPLYGIAKPFQLARLVGNLCLYLFLLFVLRSSNRRNTATHSKWLLATTAGVLVIFYVWSIQGRSEDFARRMQAVQNGYRSTDPIQVPNAVLWIRSQSFLKGYTLASSKGDGIPASVSDQDTLAVAMDETGSIGFIERVTNTSSVEQINPSSHEVTNQSFVQGSSPVLSRQGKWLAVTRQIDGRSSVWLFDLRSQTAPRLVIDSQWGPLETTVLENGDVIASMGTVASPYLALVSQNMTTPERLKEIQGAVRYPSISSDGRRLAFTRRFFGAWHLVVRDLASGNETELTHGSCNATSPSWADSRTILYASDCGRGLGLTALASVTIEAPIVASLNRNGVQSEGKRHF